MMRKRYESYSHIPPLVQDYILTVAKKKHIMSIPLNEINSFLDDMDKFYETKQEEYSEGWVL